MNYYDNPFFGETSLVADMEYDKANNPLRYANVWLGEPKSRSDAQVFKDKWTSYDFMPVPAHETFGGRYFQGADWGFSPDPMTGVRCYIKDQILWVTDEVFGYSVDLKDIGATLCQIPDFKKHKTYGDSARPDIISMLQREKFNIFSVKKTTTSLNPLERQRDKSYIESGISYMRNFKKIVIHPKCKNLIFEFTNYSHKLDKNTKQPLPEIVDKYNHGIDALRYALADYIRHKVSLADVARARAAVSQSKQVDG